MPVTDQRAPWDSLGWEEEERRAQSSAVPSAPAAQKPQARRAVLSCQTPAQASFSADEGDARLGVLYTDGKSLKEHHSYSTEGPRKTDTFPTSVRNTVKRPKDTRGHKNQRWLERLALDWKTPMSLHAAPSPSLPALPKPPSDGLRAASTQQAAILGAAEQRAPAGSLLEAPPGRQRSAAQGSRLRALPPPAMPPG